MPWPTLFPPGPQRNRRPLALERKQRYVAHLDDDLTPRSVLLVSASDKLHNLRSILSDHAILGDALWGRFHLQPAGHLWYYTALADVYRRRLGGPLAGNLARLRDDLAAIVEPAAELRWAQIGVLADSDQACLGDPAAVDAPELAGPTPRAWLRQQVDPGGLGMLFGIAETDGLPVEIGLAGSHVVAARLEFVNDVADLEAAGQGRWSPVGVLRCERVVAADAKHADQPGYHVELPLPAGRYVGEVFTSDNDSLGIRVRLV